jgi:type III secretion system FlhB-like substrate exporter
VRIATAETAPMFGKIRAPLKLRMPKTIVPKVVLPTVIEVDENIVEEVKEEEVPVARNDHNAFFTFGGNLYI